MWVFYLRLPLSLRLFIKDMRIPLLLSFRISFRWVQDSCMREIWGNERKNKVLHRDDEGFFFIESRSVFFLSNFSNSETMTV